MTGRRDPRLHARARLPERDLAELVGELAAPLLAALGPRPSIESTRKTFELVVTFWNASVLASKLWDRPRTKELNELRKRMRGREASRDDAITFDLLRSRWRRHAAESRLIGSWEYGPDESGVPRLTCTMRLPEGMREWTPPPPAKRIAIGGKFLDEVRINQGAFSRLGFPASEHRGELAPDGTATVYAMMPSALQLFAEGVLPCLGSNESVEVMLEGRQLGPMILAELHCGGRSAHSNDVAILVFKPRSMEPA